MRLTLPLILAALCACGCLGPAESEIESYRKRLASAVGDVVPLKDAFGGKLAFADAVSAEGSFLEVDQKVLLAALRQRKIFEEVADLGREGTAAAAKEKGFTFFLRFVEGRYKHHSLHHHEDRLGRYELVYLATGETQELRLDIEESERVLFIRPGGPRVDTERSHGVDSKVKIKAMVEAVQRVAWQQLAPKRAEPGP